MRTRSCTVTMLDFKCCLYDAHFILYSTLVNFVIVIIIVIIVVVVVVVVV